MPEVVTPPVKNTVSRITAMPWMLELSKIWTCDVVSAVAAAPDHVVMVACARALCMRPFSRSDSQQQKCRINCLRLNNNVFPCLCG